MTHEERLTFCKNCKNRELDQQLDIICGITKKTPDFENTCENFIEESTEARKPVYYDSIEYTVNDLSDDAKSKFREQQDVVYAIVGATAAALLGAPVKRSYSKKASIREANILSSIRGRSMESRW